MPPKTTALEILTWAAVIAVCGFALYLSAAAPAFSQDNKVVYQGF